MTGEFIKICGGALLCVIVIVVLRSVGREMQLPVQWTGILLLTGAALLSLQPVIAWLSSLGARVGAAEQVSLLLRALGIATLAQLCAELCRQSGEGAIASGVELVGRAQLLVLALPLLQQLLAAAGALLSDV